MEESKELQGLYTIFRATIYISLLLEFFMYGGCNLNCVKACS